MTLTFSKRNFRKNRFDVTLNNAIEKNICTWKWLLGFRVKKYISRQ